jgi:tRNA U34 2-thiouridine synthase MnmA/TrmU
LSESKSGVGKVLVALCGKKESVVTAWLLKKQGMQVRAVYLDLKETDDQYIHELEKKLGISIQVISCADEAFRLFQKEVKEASEEGRKVDLKQIFHQKILFPKLIELKEAHQFSKLATGHRAQLQMDSVAERMRLFRYPNLEEDESVYFSGLPQKHVRDLVLPLGSIPGAMAEKIALELQIQDEDRFRIDWSALHQTLMAAQAESEGAGGKARLAQKVEVSTEQGARLGGFRILDGLKLGDPFQDPAFPDLHYIVTEIDFEVLKVVVVPVQKRKVRELHLEDASWIVTDDLKLGTLACFVSWGKRGDAYPVHVIQFEGNRLKAFLDAPLEGPDADVFNGDSVLWLNTNQGGKSGDQEVLGGARVFKVL